MNSAMKALMALVALCLLGVTFPILSLVAFYASPNSYTINFIGKLMFIPYSIIILLAVTSFVKNIYRVYKSL